MTTIKSYPMTDDVLELLLTKVHHYRLPTAPVIGMFPIVEIDTLSRDVVLTFNMLVKSKDVRVVIRFQYAEFRNLLQTAIEHLAMTIANDIDVQLDKRGYGDVL